MACQDTRLLKPGSGCLCPHLDPVSCKAGLSWLPKRQPGAWVPSSSTLCLISASEVESSIAQPQAADLVPRCPIWDRLSVEIWRMSGIHSSATGLALEMQPPPLSPQSRLGGPQSQGRLDQSKHPWTRTLHSFTWLGAGTWHNVCVEVGTTCRNQPVQSCWNLTGTVREGTQHQMKTTALIPGLVIL